MKIGFSFGRCIRDIVNGSVDISDVYLIIARTLIHDSSQIDEVIEEYLFRPEYLNGLDESSCYKVARDLYHSGKIYQPRLFGYSPRIVSNEAVWMDLAPTIMGEDQDAEQVRAAWRNYQLALKMTSLKKFPDSPAHLQERFHRLKDDF